MVVEKRERSPNGKSVEPKSNLRQLDGHRISVNAKNTSLQNCSSYDVTVVELLDDKRPMMQCCLFDNFLTGRLDFVQNARRIVDESTRPHETAAAPPTAKLNKSLISQVMAEMGRKGGKAGGKSRMKSMGKKGRSEFGRAAVEARWAKYRAEKERTA